MPARFCLRLGALAASVASAATICDVSPAAAATKTRPTSISPPTLSGAPVEYSTLVEHNGSWTNKPAHFAYRWQDCTSAGTGCANIPGATGQIYTLKASDVGHTVVVLETASNRGGTSRPAASAPTAVITSATGGGTGGGGTGLLTFNGNFNSGVSPWLSARGAVQCANYNTPSKSPRLRGNLALVPNPAGQGTVGEFSLPADPSPRTYPFEACDLIPGPQPFTLGADQYIGLMVYVPVGWKIPNSAFFGVNIEELHFQNVNGAPITLQLHPNHVTIALQTGSCSFHGTAQPGCHYRSNADNPGCPAAPPSATCLPGYYAVPPGALAQGGWTEIVMHVHWADDSTGQLQSWYRPEGTTTWVQSSSMSGYPTVQWGGGSGCCYSGYVDLLEAYTAALTAPLNVWLNNEIEGTTLASVEGAMP